MNLRRDESTRVSSIIRPHVRDIAESIDTSSLDRAEHLPSPPWRGTPERKNCRRLSPPVDEPPSFSTLTRNPSIAAGLVENRYSRPSARSTSHARASSKAEVSLADRTTLLCLPAHGNRSLRACSPVEVPGHRFHGSAVACAGGVPSADVRKVELGDLTSESKILARPGDAFQVVLIFQFNSRLGA